jgi:hypothetical protein
VRGGQIVGRLFSLGLCLDAVVVAAPVDDGFLDGLWLHIFGEGLVGECGELVVGCEAKGDELAGGELIDVRAVGFGEQRVEAETLFEADDTVLGFEGGFASYASHQEEDDRHDDVPEVSVLVARPVVNGDVDGEDEIENEQRNDDEVKGRVVARVGSKVLRSGHWGVLFARNDGRGQHSICA